MRSIATTIKVNSCEEKSFSFTFEIAIIEFRMHRDWFMLPVKQLLDFQFNFPDSEPDAMPKGWCPVPLQFNDPEIVFVVPRQFSHRNSLTSNGRQSLSQDDIWCDTVFISFLCWFINTHVSQAVSAYYQAQGNRRSENEIISIHSLSNIFHFRKYCRDRTSRRREAAKQKFIWN